MLPQLEALLRVSPKVTSFQIVDNDPLDEDNFLFKIRCALISGHSLQIRLRAVDGQIRYSYQEFADRPLQRWDNAPHFAQLRRFPHHYHDTQGQVTDSLLTGDPMTDLPRVLSAV